MSRFKRRGLNLVVIVILIVAVIGIIVLVMQSGVGPNGVAANVDTYMQMFDNTGTRVDGEKATPEAGPIVMVDYENARIDVLQDRDPAAFRAEMHPDVRTVVIITRRSTGMPGAAVSAVAPVANVKGSYAITAILYNQHGRYIDAHTIQKESVISGAGAEGELRADADPQMVDWILEKVGG